MDIGVTRSGKDKKLQKDKGAARSDKDRKLYGYRSDKIEEG